MSVAEVSEPDEVYIEKRTCACSTALTANLGATMKPFGTTTDLVHALFLNLYTTMRACNKTTRRGARAGPYLDKVLRVLRVELGGSLSHGGRRRTRGKDGVSELRLSQWA